MTIEEKIQIRDKLYNDWQDAMLRKDYKTAKVFADKHYQITKELSDEQRDSV